MRSLRQLRTSKEGLSVEAEVAPTVSKQARRQSMKPKESAH